MRSRFGQMRAARAGAVSRASCLRRMHSQPGLMHGKASRMPKPPKPQLPKLPKPRDMAVEAGLRLRESLDKYRGEAGPKPFKLSEDTPLLRKNYIKTMLAAGYRVKLVPRGQEQEDYNV